MFSLPQIPEFEVGGRETSKGALFLSGLKMCCKARFLLYSMRRVTEFNGLFVESGYSNVENDQYGYK